MAKPKRYFVALYTGNGERLDSAEFNSRIPAKHFYDECCERAYEGRMFHGPQPRVSFYDRRYETVTSWYEPAKRSMENNS